MANHPIDGLGHVRAARAALADRLATPWWYLPAMGTALAMSALGLGVGLPSGLPLCLAGLAGSLALPFIQMRRSGLSYTGSVRGRQDWWLWALFVTVRFPGTTIVRLFVTVVVLDSTALLIGLSAAPARFAWVAAALLGLATVALGHGYERDLRAAIRGRQ